MRCRGFTLAEIVVVLALLGIIAAVAVPAFTRLDAGDDATRAAGDVVRVLHAARLAALEHAGAATVLVDPASGHYWVTLGDSGGGAASGAFAMPPGVTLLGPEPRAQFLFQPTGAAAGDSLFLKGPARTAVVTVARWTGDVEVTSR
ncbi:MAG TPA: prepilin-type N-terminal cleavage/methylation domain-containing protein [Gemmatimonadales bacterium]|nr:prepilin-type N-terminal cleavage/methylation domain-containing protein [Gemmatimonadales bacterium]